MSLLEEYLDYRPGLTSLTPAKTILFRIVRDLTDRRGLRQEWDLIMDEIKEQILADWLQIIEQNLKK